MEQRFDESEHPRDEHGRFVSKGYQRVSTDKEINNFVNNSFSSKTNEKATVSKVKEDAKIRIKQITGKEINRVIIDNASVVHSLEKEEHHISKDDFKKIGRIVNTTSDITLQTRKHQNNQVLVFKEQRNNGLELVMEVRAGRHNLALVTMYRPKKAK